MAYVQGRLKLILALALIAFATPVFAAGVTGPATSSTGDYTVSWSSLSCGTNVTFYLYENYGPSNMGCALSKTYNDKAPGSYLYHIEKCTYKPFLGEDICTGGPGGIFTSHTVTVTPPVPAIPASISVPGSNNNGAYTISWSSSSYATSYLLQERKDGGSWVTKYTGASTSKAFSGQSDGSYTYRVKATNATGSSGYRTSSSFNVLHPPVTPSAISAPTGTDTDGSYTVSWASSSTATAYLVQEQKNGGTWITKYSGAGLSKSFSGQANATYRYRVRASNAGGNSGLRYSSTFTVLLPPPPPSSISTPTGYDIDGDYTVSWASSGTATSYTLQEQSNGGAWTLKHTGAATSKAFSSRPEASYRYRVSASNASGDSGYTYSSTFEVLQPPGTPGTPNAPTTNGNGNYTVSWGPSSGTVATYTLQEQVNGGGFSPIQNAAATSAVITDNDNGTYGYRVRACNAGSCSASWTATATTLVISEVPGPIQGPTSDSDGVYVLSWNPSNNDPDRYELERQIDGGSFSQLTLSTPLSIGFQTSETSNATYGYRVRACNGGACSSYTATKSVTVVLTPSAPGSINLPATSDGNYSLSWGAASGAVDSYELQEQVDGGAFGPVQDSASTSYSTIQLASGTYGYRVRACNALSCGNWTATASVLVDAPEPATPPSPSIPSLPSPDGTSDSVGSMAGSFRVDESASATYTIPLVTAPGSGGVTPQLALSYSSQAGNGVLGVGWSLDGLSSITRCRRTVETEGSTLAVQLDTTDRYCLDGQKLIAVDGTYGASGTEYRTEVDSFAVVTSHGQTGNGPDYFEVRRKDGTTWTYGGTSNSQNVANGNDTTTIVSWLVSTIEDSSINGNGIDFTYAGYGTGERLITQIDYSQNNHKVVINYESRTDTSRGYMAGSTYELTKRVDSIETWSNGTQMREYTVNYQYSSPHGHSQITAVQECNGNGTVCYPATTFNWSNATSGFGSQATTAFTANFGGAKPGDINGDGFMDLVFIDGDTMRVRVSNGFNLVTRSDSLNVGNDYPTNSWHLVDYNGDGKTDLLYEQSGNWYVKLASASNLLGVSPLSTGISGQSPQSLDANGDGLADLVYNTGPFNPGLKIRYMQPSSGAYPYEFGAEQAFGITGLQDPPEASSREYRTFFQASSSLPVDVNGDGNVDYLGKVLQKCTDQELGCSGYPDYKKWVLFTSTGSSLKMFEVLQTNTYDDPYTSADFRVVDVNGDGYTDILKRGSNELTWSLFLSNGKEFAFASSFTLADEDLAERITFFDYNRDGRLDLTYFDGDGGTANETVKVIYYNESTQNFAGSAVTVATGFKGTNEENQLMMLDINGDGRQDIVNLYFSTGQQSDVRIASAAYVADQKITKITNGLGAETDVTYKSLLDPNESGLYTKESDANTLDWGSPVFDLNSSVYVVSEVSSSAPVASNANAKSTVSYSYKGAKIQSGGRGFLGFHEVTSVDEQTSVKTTTTFAQEFPQTGMPLSTVVKLDAAKLSEATNTLTNFSSSSVCGEGSSDRPYVSQSIEKLYDLADESLMKTVTTVTTPDACGNVLTLNVETENGSSVYASNSTYETNTTNTYYNSTNSSFELVQGRLKQTTVVHKRDTASETRVSSFEYNATTGFLTKEIIEPGLPAMTLTTTYTHDNFGNRTTATSTAAGYDSRVTTFAYDTDGQDVDYKTDVYGRDFDIVSERNDFGQPTEVADINLNTADIVYGSMGRKYFERNETGGYSQTTFVDCTSACSGAPSGAVYMTEVEAAGAPLSRTYFDVIGREMRAAVQGFDGSWVYVDTEYDNVGRVKRKSEPYFSGGTVHWSTFVYDILGRATQVTHPDSSVTTTDYDGTTDFRTVTTNALTQTRTEDRNALGELERVTDDAGGQLLYEYHPQGNLAAVTAPGGAVTVMAYDERGRKESMDDPDKGSWSYTYNPFGELETQTDAKGQTSTLEYDRLGRLVSRVDHDGSSTVGNAVWVYDVGGNALGKLYQEYIHINGAGTADIIRTYGYDDYSRLDDVTTDITGEASFTQQTTYDQFGRVFQQFDASEAGAQRVGQQFKYNTYGYQHRVIEARDSANEDHVYHEIIAIDARGNVTEEQIGGLTSYRGYEADTGRLATIYTNAGYLQDLTYTFDDLGNLYQREDDTAGNGFVETFGYDDLNRLTSTSSADATNLTITYDAAGNILTKSNMESGATYYYGAGSAGPHAVTSAGSITYSYDANGNMTGGDGRTINYTTFDKPDSIAKGGHTTTFKYGPNRARFLRTDNGGSGTTTTLYVGNVERIEAPGGLITTKRYLGGKVIVTTTSANPTPVEVLVLTDHLGSTYALVNRDTGYTLNQGMSFDAWGLRRDTDWSDLTTTELVTFDTGNTRRGYTGHEHMDEVGLIHMNGRVYDPRLGRMLSADPIVQAAANTQSYNRYSYVFNNPLSYTDPSGFSAWTKFRDKFLKPVIAIVAAVYTFNWAMAAQTVVGGTTATLSIGGNVVASASLPTIYSTGSALTAGAIAGAASGFVAGAILTGTLKGAVNGAFSGAIFGGIGGHFGNVWNPQRVLANSLGGGVSSRMNDGSFKDGFKLSLTTSLLTLANYRMRLAMVRQSKLNPDNVGKSSDGFFGDGVGIGGTRKVLKDPIGPLSESNYLKCDGPAGGCQGVLYPSNGDVGSRLSIFPYSRGSALDTLVESFAGPHDWLSDRVGMYDSLGNGILRHGVSNLAYESLSYGLIPVAGPFSVGALAETTPGVMTVAHAND